MNVHMTFKSSARVGSTGEKGGVNVKSSESLTPFPQDHTLVTVALEASTPIFLPLQPIEKQVLVQYGLLQLSLSSSPPVYSKALWFYLKRNRSPSYPSYGHSDQKLLCPTPPRTLPFSPQPTLTHTESTVGTLTLPPLAPVFGCSKSFQEAQKRKRNCGGINSHSCPDSTGRSSCSSLSIVTVIVEQVMVCQVEVTECLLCAVHYDKHLSHFFPHSQEVSIIMLSILHIW